jgi:hypothetical protein
VRPQIPLDRLAVVAELDPGVVIELPEFAELWEKLLGVNGNGGLAVASDRISTSNVAAKAR